MKGTERSNIHLSSNNTHTHVISLPRACTCKVDTSNTERLQTCEKRGCKKSQLIPVCRAIVAICSDIKTKHINTNLMFVWPCILNMKWRVRPTRCNNYDLLIIHQLNMFRASLCPIFRGARPYITAYGFQHLMCSLVSWGAGSRPCALCRVESGSILYTVHTVCIPAPQDTSQHKCWKPYAVIYGLALLKMGHNDARNMLSWWIINKS